MIILIDNYDSFTYNLYQSIASFNNEVKVVRNDQFKLSDIRSINPEGVIISPGPGRPENAGLCVELIKQYGADIPIFGVCLGHQAIGQAFGADIIQAPEIMHGKSTLLKHDNSSLYKNISQEFSAGRYHSLIIDKATLPSDFEISSQTTNGDIMGIYHKNFPLFGVQFHPESILTEQGDILIENFITYCQERKTC